MGVTIEKIPGAALLPYTDMKEMMLSELTRRLGVTLDGRNDYED